MNSETQKKQTGGSADSETVLLVGANIKDDTTPISLNELLLSKVLATLSPHAHQERRFIECMAITPMVKTKDACREIACVNLGHLRKVTQAKLACFGLEARCVHPPKPIMNGYGESTGQVLWALYRLKRGGQHG